MPTPNDYSNFQFTKAEQSYSQHGDNRGGNYGQVNPEATGPDDPGSAYPNIRGYGFDENNSQFSSNVDGDPRALLESTRSGAEAHADMNASYGLTQPTAPLGSHPWLRDSLTVPTVYEPGPAAPPQGIDNPNKRGK